MRTDLLLLALVFSLLLARNTHAQFTENFNDGDFTSGNVWGGDAALWLVEDTILASNSQIVNDTFTSLGTFTGNVNNTQSLYIAYNSMYGGYLNSSYGNALIYNRALNQSELTQLYNAQKSRFGL